MSTKKIFFGLTAICSTLFSVEASTIHTVEDVSDIFRRPTTIVNATMKEYASSGLSLIKIKGIDPGTAEQETRCLRFSPSSVTWQHNDQAVPPSSQKTAVFNIKCGLYVLNVTYGEGKEVRHASELAAPIIVNSSGQLVNPYHLAPYAEGFFSWAEKVWTRPDGTQRTEDSKLPVKIEPVVKGHSVPREHLFSAIQVGVPVPVMKKLTLPTGVLHETLLYHIVKKEVPHGQLSKIEYCYKHDWEVQNSWTKLGDKEFRHAYKTYETQQVLEVLYKRNNGVDENQPLPLVGGRVFVNVTKLLNKQDIGTGQLKNPKNNPVCTKFNYTLKNGNHGFPENYRVPPHLL